MDAINNEKKKRGRPFKMEIWIEKLEEVIAEGNVLFLTDNELRLIVNKRLDKSNQISRRTLEYWVAGEYHPDAEIGERFLSLIEEARITEKLELGKRMFDDPKRYKATTWLLERKFEELNLKRITEKISKTETTNIIQITAGSEVQRMMIDNIINAEFVEVAPRSIPAKNDNEKEDEFEF